MTGKQKKEVNKLIRALCLVAIVNGKEVKAKSFDELKLKVASKS